MEITCGGTRIAAVQGDLTAMDLDVVVNAANERLAHGGGLAAALSRAGGPAVQEASTRWVRELGPVDHGAAITTAGDMPARALVHVVGPRYRGDGSDEPALRAAVDAALHAAAGLGARSIGMPAISAGIFGYPLEESAAVIADEVAAWCTRNPGILDDVRLVGFDPAAVEAFAAGLRGAEN
ncbi:MAG TPA: macro domain-containing protein [Acidimicrobiia bacterium]|nr:macro domain-containing protein [Acidimicrobiia bacterium]